jgi:hypothetical protein
MRKSPITLTALAAFAAAATIGFFVQTGAAEEASQLRRVPAQIAPAKVKPIKPSRPQSLQMQRETRPTGPATIVIFPSANGPKGPGDIADPSQALANLVVVPYYNNPSNLPEGFPTHSYCVKKPTGGTPNQIRFYIKNTGNSATGSFQWTPMFPNAGAAPATVIGNIPANGQMLITQGIPDGCYTPGFSGSCEFSIHLDDHNEVPEWSEANTYNSYCVSPAG